MDALHVKLLERLIAWRTSMSDEDIQLRRDLQGNSNHFETCQNVLAIDECPPDIQMFLLGCMRSLAQKWADNWDQETVNGALNWCIEYLSSERPLNVIETVALVYGDIICRISNRQPRYVKAKFDEIEDLEGDPENEYLIICKFSIMKAVIDTIKQAAKDKQKSHSIDISGTIGQMIIPSSFELSSTFLKENKGIESRKMALEVVRACLSFGDTEEGIVQPNELKHVITDSEFLRFIFDIYRKTKWNCALRCIECFSATALQSFTGRTKDEIMLVLGQEMISVIHPEMDLTNMFNTSVILKNWSKKASPYMLSRMLEGDSLKEVLRIVKDWTYSLLKNRDRFAENEHIYRNVMEFWRSMINTATNIGGEIEIIVASSTDAALLRKYVRFLMKLVLVDENIETVLDYGNWLENVRTLTISNRTEAMKVISDCFSATGHHAHVSLYLKIVGAMFKQDGWNPTDHREMQTLQDSLKGHLMGLLSSDVSHPLFEKCVVDVIGICIKDDDLKPDLFQRLVRTMDIAAGIPPIIEACVKTIESTNLDEACTMFLLEHWQEFKFIYDPNNCHAKDMFFAYLVKCAYKCNGCERLMNEIASNSTIMTSLIDFTTILTGIFRCTCDTVVYQQLWEWFYRNAIKMYACEYTPELANASLELWNLITDENHGCERKIRFGKYSTMGIVLFKESVGFIECILSQLQALSTSEEIYIELIYRICKVSCNLLSNNYVCYEIFELYKDDTLPRFIHEFSEVISTINPPTVLQYPGTPEAIWSTIKAISEMHLRICQPESVHLIMKVVSFGITCDNNSVVDNSLEIVHNVCNCVIDNRDEAFAQQYIDDLMHDCISIWNMLMKLPNSKLTSKGPFLRKLTIICPESIEQVRCALLRCMEPGEQAEQCEEIFAAFTAELPEIMERNLDNNFNVHLQKIHDFIRTLGREIVLTI